jgi:UDP-2-acetamido-3-amino-2,3-dideoxy-glucuronate N-acetyltransferase
VPHPVPEGVHVHPNGLCESAQVGAGTRIWAFAHVLDGAVIGRDCNLGDCSFVEGGAVLGDRVVVKNGVSIWSGVALDDDVFVGPNVVFTNDLVPRAAPYRTPPEDWLPTRVHAGASLGANATLVCGITVGRHAFVGAGAVVTRDVPAHGLVVGNPAKPVGWICLCGGRLSAPFVCPDCGRAYQEDEHGLRQA